MNQQLTLDNWRGPIINKNLHKNKHVVSTPSSTPTNKQQTLRQTTITNGTDDSLQQYDSWGHELTNKHEQSLRIALRNISSLPKEAYHNKNDIFIQDIYNSQADIYCATEVNVAWQNIPAEDKIHERFKGRFEFAKFISSNNKDKSFKGAYQPGGTLMVVNGNICSRIVESGSESHTLQRWSWLRIRGRHDMNVIVVNLYRPVHSNGPISTYQQHKAVLLDEDIDECPRKNLLNQLAIQIRNWHQQNYKVIVTGDFNEDINIGTIPQFFRSINMEEMIIRQHGDAPNTMIKGTKPIDGIFCTKDMRPLQSGYLGFDWGMASDHRVIWIDFHIPTYLGTTTTPLWKPKARRLQCNNPNIVQDFNRLRLQHLHKTKAADLQQTLNITMSQHESSTWKQCIEELDRLRIESINYADRHCRKLRMGEVPWSPDLQQAMRNITYLQRCRLKYINGYGINSRTLLKTFHKTTFTSPITQPDDIIEHLRQEFKKYNEIKKNAKKLRYNFLEQLAESQATVSHKPKEKIYKQLLLHESIRTTFRKIKFSLKDTRSGVTMVEAPTQTGTWKMITEKEDIEKECIKENIRRLTQASNTPPMLQDQIELLGNLADTEVSKQILWNTIQDTTGIHPAIVRMLPHLSIPDTIKALPPIRDEITDDEYKWMWHRSREHTSCGISGLHFGHFIASCENKLLCDMDRWFITTALTTGYALERWKQGIDVMIPKKVDSQRVDKLRTIVLMEPDFNLVNKLIGRRVMSMAESAGSIAPEQFGSRKRKSAIIHAVNKQLTTDILRQERKNFSLIILDAKACYDRITPMYAAFSMKRQGASDNMIKLMFNTIEEMTHYIRTSYGDSTLTYRQEEIKFHGILQGNGAGPTIWALISSTLLDNLRQQGLGVIIETEDGNNISIPAFAFVDDTDLVQQLQDEHDTQSPQKAVTEWTTSLSTSGGLIIGDKCSFQIIKHFWHNNRWSIHDEIDDTITITIPDETGNLIPIRQSSANTGEIALGIAFSPKGDMTDEIQYLRQKTTKWAEKIASANLSTSEAWIALKTTVFKTIEYALPTTLLSKKQVQFIVSPALNIGLAKAGICRKISRTIVYTPNKYQGFGLHDPYVTQGIKKLQLLFNPYNTLTQRLINESWKRLVNECGIGPNVLEANYAIYKPILTTTWITNLWEFLSDSRIQLKKLGTTSPFRMQDDNYINAKVLDHSNWTPTEKIEFNACRLYLKIELVSDIITANGMQVRQNILRGILDQTTTGNIKLQSPTPRPSAPAWKTWEKMLRTSFNCNSQQFLLQPITAITNTESWKWFLQPSTSRIIHKQTNYWDLYTTADRSRRTRNKAYRYRSTIPPTNEFLVPITVYTCGNNIKIDGLGTNRELTNITTQVEWCNTIQHQIVGDINVLYEYITKEELILLSDATVHEDNSYAAWIISTPNSYGNGTFIRGYAKIFEKTTDSHRSECFGILGAIHTLQAYQQLWQTTSTQSINLVCDNKAAINYTGDMLRYTFITSNIPDFDVLGAIRKKLVNVKFKYQHVKGHQDKSAKPFNIYTMMNIHVDALASEAQDEWEALSNPHKSYNYIQGEEWQIIYNNEKNFKNIDEVLRERIGESIIPSIWNKYNRVSQEWFYEVNWPAIKKAMSLSNVQTRHWIIKRCARDCGAHAILKRRKERDDDKCPFCGLCETVEHVYICQHNKVQQLWETIQQELAVYLESIQTAPNIVQQLLAGINSWRSNSNIGRDPMILDQSQIGWNGILEGVLGLHWEEEQDIYSKSSDGTTGSKWAHLVVRKLWRIAWDIWEHRNLEAHKEDQQRNIEQLQQQILNEQSIGSQGYVELQQLLNNEAINKVMEGNVTYMTCWIRMVQAKRQRLQRFRDNSTMFTQMRQTLRQFLNQA